MKIKKNNNNSVRKQIFMIIMIFTVYLSLTSFAVADNDDFAYLHITLLNQDPDPAEQGEYLDLRWKVIKMGNEQMDDITFNLELDYPFFFDQSDSAIKKIGNWKGYSSEEEYYILHYKVRIDDEALEDIYDIKLKITNDKNGIYITKEFEIEIGDKTTPEFVLGSLITSPIKLLANTNENQLQITLENIGDENAETVRMELEFPEGFTPTYGYSNRANLGTINAGNSNTGTFYVDLNETIIQGEYDGMITIHYKEANDNDNEYKVAKLPLNIPVNGKPMFSIESIKTIPEKVREGNEVKLLLTVKNTGTKEAESVSIRAFKEYSQPFEFNEKSDFIGKLKPGEIGEAIIKFKVEDGANVKTYLLDLEVRSIYNDEVITENEVIPIRVQNGEKKNIFSKSPIISTLIIIIIVSLGVGKYYLFRKNKKK